MNPNQLPSQRQERFSEVIRAIISDAFFKGDFLNDKIELGSVTVSYVKMSKDLKIAHVYIMPIGGQDKNKILDLVNENKFYFQKVISDEKLKTKFTPKIKFFLDDTFEEAEKIEKLLLNKRVLRDLK